MRQVIEGLHYSDENGNPVGGSTIGTGIRIDWQNGPLGRGEERLEPNGAFVEGVIAAAIDRLNWYQSSRFRCAANASAIRNLNRALEDLKDRTKVREDHGVEGTHEV